jgi:hypothetical protein
VNRAVTLIVALMLLAGVSWASQAAISRDQLPVRPTAPVRGLESPAAPLAPPLATIWTDNMDSPTGWTASNPPTGWHIYYTTPVDANDWNSYYWGGSNNYIAWIYWSPDENAADSMISPTINCGAYVNCSLSVWAYFSHFSGAYTAKLIGSTDNGATWPYTIYDYYGAAIYGVTQYFNTGWMDTKSQVKLCWVFTGQHYNFNEWAFDNPTVFGTMQVQNDMRVYSITSPVGQYCTCDTIIPVCQVQNLGTNAQSNVPVYCKFWNASNALVYNQTQYINSIAAGATVDVTFPYFYEGIEDVTYKDTFQVALTGDQQPGNDKTGSTFYVSAYGGGEVNYYDNGTWYVAMAMDVGGEFAWKFPTPSMGVKGVNIQCVWWGYGTSPATQHILVYNADGTGGAPGTTAYEGDYSIGATYYVLTSNYLNFPGTVHPTTGSYYISHRYLTSYGVGPAYSQTGHSGNDWMKMPGGSFELLNYSGYADASFDGMTHPLEAAALHDIGTVSIDVPAAVIDSNTTFTPQVKFANTGMKDRPDIPVCYQLYDSTGALVFADTAHTGAFAVKETMTVTFANSYTPHPGDWASVAYPFPACDKNPANDTLDKPLFVRYLNVLCEIQSPRMNEVPGVVPVEVKLTNNGNVDALVPRLDVTVTTGYGAWLENIAVPAYSSQVVTLTPWVCPSGSKETCTAWITYPADMNHGTLNDGEYADTAQTVITAGIPGWAELTPLPSPPSGKAIKDGGCMAYDAGTDLIYASKGYKTGDFYAYSVPLGTWATLTGIPLGAEGKPPYKGSVLCSDGNGKLYLTKGNNTVGFWGYDANPAAAGAWTQLTNVPTGSSGKKVKQGAALAWASSARVGHECAYLLKGYRNEFYRYDPAANQWTNLLDAPIGAANHLKWDAGSWMVADADAGNMLYAFKAKYHEMYKYDTDADTWSHAITAMPIPGSAGNKKAKDGSCAAWYSGKIYAFKGGNTTEFWRYFPLGDTWNKQDDIPLWGMTGARKKVKAGAALAGYPGTGVYAFKGNKSLDFWRYTPYQVAAGAQPNRDGVTAGSTEIGSVSFAIAPNPLAGGYATVRYSLPKAGLATLNVFDVTGRTVLTQTLAAGRTGSASLDLRKLEAGVYLVKVTTEGFSTTQKLVVEH